MDSGLSPSMVLIPSVSSNNNTNSSHSSAIVDSQIPRVHTFIEWPSLNVLILPIKCDMKKDFPERWGPQIASTAMGLLMVFSRSSATGTSCRVFEVGSRCSSFESV